MKTFIWKYDYMAFVCNVETVEEARDAFGNTILSIFKRDSFTTTNGEMLLISDVVKNQEPIILEDGLCALLTRTKE